MDQFCPACEGKLDGDGQCKWCSDEPIVLFSGVSSKTYKAKEATYNALETWAKKVAELIQEKANDYYSNGDVLFCTGCHARQGELHNTSHCDVLLAERLLTQAKDMGLLE